MHKKYFILNKESDFFNGYGMGIHINPDGITLEESVQEGVYYTKIFDSRERLMSWHRLLLAGEMPDGIFYTVSVYAADSLALPDGSGTVEDLIYCGELAQEEKDQRLFWYLKMEAEGRTDLLLFSVTGRYLWLKIAVRRQGNGRFCIRRIQVYFPKHTWLSYLPEIYAEDKKSASFLERYLGIFQSLYEDMTEKIENMPGLLEPVAEEEGMLYELADWIAVEHKELWDKEQMLYLIQNGRRIRQSRGTIQCIKELVRLYTKNESYLVEYHKIQPFFDGGKREWLLRRLYASNCWEFTLMVEGEGMERQGGIHALEQVVDMAKPAHMICRMVVLKPYIFLDQHSYLGINSVLGKYRPLRLDGLSAVPFSVLPDQKKRKAKGDI